MITYPTDFITRTIHDCLVLDTPTGATRSVRVPEIDYDSIDWDRVDRVIGRGYDIDGNEYELIRYTASDNVERLCAYSTYDPFEPTAEDFTEWAAASCGETYNSYTGRPWLD